MFKDIKYESLKRKVAELISTIEPTIPRYLGIGLKSNIIKVTKNFYQEI